MKEIQFSHREGDYLILKDENGEHLRLELNTGLRQAVRNQSAHSSQFSPGEVQALIRSGLSLDEVANKLGVEADEIEPFAAPVIAELDYIQSSAVSVLVVAQDFDETVPLGQLLKHKLGDTEIRTRKEDGVWVISADATSGTAEFSFDPKNNWLKPINDAAKDIFEEQSAPVPLSVIDNRTEEPAEEEQQENASSVATDLLEELQRRRAQKKSEPEMPKPESSSKRPPLPSWDEIVFGAGDSKNEEEED